MVVDVILCLSVLGAGYKCSLYSSLIIRILTPTLTILRVVYSISTVVTNTCTDEIRVVQQKYQCNGSVK
jgi:hypothetical protein